MANSLVNHLRGVDTQKLFLEVAYGKHVVEGDLCKSLKTDSDPFDIYVQHKLGKREWNACKALWWRGFAIPTSDYAFHPGTLSSGNSDTIQGVDDIFDMDIPHSLTSWIRAKLPQTEIQEIDTKKTAPEGLYGIFECLKINDYNSSGVITDFAYSANPARVVADLFLIEGKRNPNRIDWGAWAEWRDFLDLQKLCDYSQIPKFVGFGLTASYYNGQSFNTLIEKRIDAVVEFLASNGAPAYGLEVNNFSARYEGKIKAQFDETYTFYLTHNDGGKLWVNNSLLIDQWGTTGTHSATIALEADEFYAIKVEWKDGAGDAEIRLEWESATQPREVVPADRLYPKAENKTNYESHIAFKQPTRLDDAVRQVLQLCNSTYQRVNGKYRFFCYEQLQNSSYTFDEAINLYPNSVQIEPLNFADARNVWSATCRDLESQYLEQLATPLSIELGNLITLAGRRNDSDLLDFHNSNRWQAYRLLEHRAKRAVAENSIRIIANCESYPVLRGDRVKLNLEFADLQNYECRVVRSLDKSSETSADDREFTLKEWYPSETLVPELVADETNPTVPGSLAGSAVSSSRIDLSWTAATDNRGVAGYELEQNGVVFNVGLVLNISRNALIHSTAYTFKIRAYDAAGNRSSWSSPVVITTPISTDVTAPTIPGGFAATPVSISQINLSWTASTDSESGVAGYEISQDGSVINVGNVLSSSRMGFDEQSTHLFKVRAYDAAGNRSAWSSEIEAETLSQTPDTPTLSAVAFYTDVELSWTAVSGATGYEIEEDSSVIDVGLANNETRSPSVGYHTYRVRAYNASGYSAWSGFENVLTGYY